VPIFSQSKADHAIEFIETLCSHVKGRWAKKPFRLMDWQIKDVIVPAFGTLKENGKRQYRIVYIEVPKKCGKSELASCFALYGLCGDGEHGAEVYSAAGDRDQASLVYFPAAEMVRTHPTLRKRLTVIDSRKRIVDHQTASFYQVLSSETYTKHGLNPSMIIFDELHAQPTRELWDVLTVGTDIAREQQMIVVITTAGIRDPESIGWKIHKYAKDVKDGIIKDETFLPVIYAAEDEEDWENEQIWIGANPSLGHIFDIENLRHHYQEVKNRPDEVNNFLRFRLNIWTSGLIEAFPMKAWQACTGLPIVEKRLKGRKCYGGLDLASVSDITSFSLVFPPDDINQKYTILVWNWLPEDVIHERTMKDSVPYEAWVKQKWIQTTPGNATDYNFIVQKIKQLSNLFDIQEIAFDRWGSPLIINDLVNECGFQVDIKVPGPHLIQFGQGFKSMSPPSKELIRLTLEQKIWHGGNPVLTWAVNNIVFSQDAAGNLKPDKGKSSEKIDPIVATIMALARATVKESGTSIFEDLSGFGDDAEVPHVPIF